MLAARTAPVPLITAPVMSVLLAAGFSELLTHLWEWRPVRWSEEAAGRILAPLSPRSEKLS